jgi:membrane-bound ClpP family serine protease
MWITAGVLLGLVVVTSLVGFHTGPHTHVAAGVIGVLAGGWLVYMASNGRSAPLLWVLFSADVVISAAIGIMGWTAVQRSGDLAGRPSIGRLEGKEAVAITDLNPDGIVRVAGEQWSATCVNGTLPAGSRAQVLQEDGVRLEVWAERLVDERPGGLAGTSSVAEPREKEEGT